MMETLDSNRIPAWAVRIIGSDSLSQMSALLDEGFSLKDSEHFLDDFPVWSPSFPNKRVTVFGAFHGRDLGATAGLRLAEMQLGNGAKIAIGIIGAVVTHPSCRKKGLASLLVSHAVRKAEQAGASFVALWGSEHSFYQKFGFQLCGQQCRVPLLDLALPGENPVTVRRGWESGIFELVRKRDGGLALSETDRSWFGAHKNVEWYYTGPSWGPIAYAAISRGIDLKGVVHEWGGEFSSLQMILASIRHLHPEATLLAKPEQLNPFGVTPKPEQIEYLCLGKYLGSPRVPESALWFWGLDSA